MQNNPNNMQDYMQFLSRLGNSSGVLGNAVPDNEFDRFHEKNPGISRKKPTIIEFDPKDLEYPEEDPPKGVKITVTKPEHTTEKYYNGEIVYNTRPEMG